jgi:hypothetical protein
MEATYSSEATVFAFKTTRSQNLVDHNVNNNRRERFTIYIKAYTDTQFIVFRAFSFLNSNLRKKAELIFLSSLYLRKLWNMPSGYHFCLYYFRHTAAVYSDRLRDGRPGVDSRQGKQVFLHSAASKLAMWPTQPPIQWVPGGPFPRGKAAGT